jgi:hypothetical protein
MSRLSLPARSLRGRPASLRTVPDSAACLLRKRLIWRALLVMRPAVSGAEPIFLPALRERRSGRAAGAPARPGYRTDGCHRRHRSDRNYRTHRRHRQNWCDGCHRPVSASPSEAAPAHGEHSPILSRVQSICSARNVSRPSQYRVGKIRNDRRGLRAGEKIRCAIQTLAPQAGRGAKC